MVRGLLMVTDMVRGLLVANVVRGIIRVTDMVRGLWEADSCRMEFPVGILNTPNFMLQVQVLIYYYYLGHLH